MTNHVWSHLIYKTSRSRIQLGLWNQGHHLEEVAFIDMLGLGERECEMEGRGIGDCILIMTHLF